MSRPSYPPWFDHQNNSLLGDKYKLWSSSLRSFLSLLSLHPSGPNIPLGTLFSQSPKYIHLEDGDCNVCRTVRKPATFDAAYPRRPKLHPPSVFYLTWEPCTKQQVKLFTLPVPMYGPPCSHTLVRYETKDLRTAYCEYDSQGCVLCKSGSCTEWELGKSKTEWNSGRDYKCKQFWWENLNGRDHLEDPNVDES
jgi:hypothetical protein